MTIEEKVQQTPSEFQAILDSKTADIKTALNNLSSQLDVIFNGAIKEYCEKSGATFEISAIPTYKLTNKLITGKLDGMIKEHIAEKRKDL